MIISGYYASIYYFDVIKPNKIAKQYNMDLIDNRSGPYYKIYYGKKYDKNKNCYLIYVRNIDNPYIVYEAEGITKQDAIHTAETYGYNSEHVLLRVNTQSKVDSIKEHLSWWVYYDRVNAKYIEIDFVSGKVTAIH